MLNEIEKDKLNELCNSIRTFCNENKFKQCISIICESMSKYPDSAVPHNLLGVVLEKMGEHMSAMKHFRASLALDPAYLPANQNLQTYGTFFSDGQSAFDESDVVYLKDDLYHMEKDDTGIKHIIKNKEGRLKVIYDENGIGHFLREDK